MTRRDGPQVNRTRCNCSAARGKTRTTSFRGHCVVCLPFIFHSLGGSKRAHSCVNSLSCLACFVVPVISKFSAPPPLFSKSSSSSTTPTQFNFPTPQGLSSEPPRSWNSHTSLGPHASLALVSATLAFHTTSPKATTPRTQHNMVQTQYVCGRCTELTEFNKRCYYASCMGKRTRIVTLGF